STEFDVTYTVTVQNFGNATTLSAVQVTDDLTQTFGGATGFSIAPGGEPQIISGPPTLQTTNGTAFTGDPNNGSIDLLDETGSLAPGEAAVIRYTVRLDTTAANINVGTTYNNTVVAEGTTPIGLRVTDNSVDDSTTQPNDNPNPDPDGDGDPVEQSPTPVELPPLGPLPNINVSEQFVDTQIAPTDGTFGTNGANTARVRYRIRVQNTGPERLEQVTLTNDFTDTFDLDDTGFEIVGFSRVDGTIPNSNPVNGDYNGGDTIDGTGAPRTENPTLVTGGALDPGEFTEYEILVDVDTTNNGETLITTIPGTFFNFTTATGVGTDPTNPSGITVTDVSNDITGFNSLEEALNPPGDPTNGGSSTDTANPPVPDTPENIRTPVTLSLTSATDPRINVSEEVVTTVLNPAVGPAPTFASTARVTYRIRVQNTGPEDLREVRLINDFTDTFDNGTRGGSGPDNGFEIIEIRQLPGNGANANPFSTTYDGGDSFENGTGPTNNPNGDAILLSGGSLVVGEFSEYEIDVDVNLAGDGATLITELPGPYNNFTRAEGIGNDPTTPSNIPVADLSNDRNLVTPVPPTLEGALDPAGGSDTGGAVTGAANTSPEAIVLTPDSPDNIQTPVSLTATPEISVIERIDPSQTQTGAIPGATFGDSNVRVVYQIVVRNIGLEDLQNVVLNNNFIPTFGTSGQGATDDFLITGVSQFGGVTTVPVNPNFDGSSVPGQILAGDGSPTSTLNVGEFAVYEIEVDVNTAGTNVAPRLPGPFNNQTMAEGDGVISQLSTEDFSNDINPFPNGGTTPDPTASDPNGNLEADEPDENIPTPLTLGADLKVVKRITRVIRGGIDLPVAGIDSFNDQSGTDDDNTLASLSGNSLPLGVSEGPNQLQSGDIIEYTIYFFNQGIGQAANVEICDELQVPSILQPGSLTLASPTALSQLGNNLDNSFVANGSLLFPQAPLATLAASCLSFPGTFPAGTPAGGLGVGAGGGVIAGGENLGLNVDANEVGAVRFNVTIP
ncbi:MAG: DUF11 domain-containing protein, partial [Leptolyngbya sp. SIO3F4]|nr:DUF11 domain-containing protein [Leptolyngbya sp. SIO3F4]